MSRLACAVLVFCAPLAAGAQVDPVQLRLTVDEAGPAEGTVHLAVRFGVAPGWHISAPDPGETGLATTLSFSLPAGVEIVEERWPPHEVVDWGGFRQNAYAGEVTVDVRLRVPVGVRGAPVRLEAAWGACREVCVPGRAVREVHLPPS